jgi:hypothetical protein
VESLQRHTWASDDEFSGLFPTVAALAKIDALNARVRR